MAARQSFRAWLINSKGLSRKVAADTLSRCGRVERMIGTSLDAAVASDDGVERVVARVRRAGVGLDSDGLWRKGSGSNLVRAVRLYAEFIRAHPTAARTDEIMDAKRAAFRTWLMSTRRVEEGTVSAIVSRCGRVERIIGAPP